MTESRPSSEFEIDRTLRDLAAHIDYPATPDLTNKVRHRIEQLPSRRRQSNDQGGLRSMPGVHVSENEHNEHVDSPHPWLKPRYQERGLRRYFPRELVQMAAAILVLILVAGVLAVTFRSQDTRNQGGVGGNNTHSAGTQDIVPTFSGSSQVVTTFPPATIFFVDGSGVSGNVRAELLADGNLHLVGTADNAGHQLLWMAAQGTCATREAALSTPGTVFGYRFYATRSQADAHQESFDVTLSTNGRVPPFFLVGFVDGGGPVMACADLDPSKGRVPATALPDTSASGTVVLTPNQSVGITFAEAQQLTPFYLAQPQWTPAYLVSKGADTVPITPAGLNNGTPITPVSQDVILRYGPVDATQQYFVELFETDQPSGFGFPGNPTPTTLTIGGQTVTRVEYTHDGPMVNYEWRDQGTIFSLNAKIAGPLTEHDVEHMIASMLGHGS